jgi:purine-nucleoside phosphorylase
MKEGFGERVARAAASLGPEYRPKTAVILGSGLSGIVHGLGPGLGPGLGWREIGFASIPEFPRPTVQGHKGILCLSEKAAIMAGRFHYYEGHAMDDVVLPIFVLREIGVETLILTNAAGGVNLGYSPGDLVLIKDHINLMGVNPFVGPNPARPGGDRSFGDRFFDMTNAYPADLRDLARGVAREKLGKDLAEGVYAAFSGPSYETPAEVRMARTLGADLVGMSTAPEAIAASYLGMRVLGVSCVTNMAAGVAVGQAAAKALSHAEVVETGKSVESELKALIFALLDRL